MSYMRSTEARNVDPSKTIFFLETFKLVVVEKLIATPRGTAWKKSMHCITCANKTKIGGQMGAWRCLQCRMRCFAVLEYPSDLDCSRWYWMRILDSRQPTKRVGGTWLRYIGYTLHHFISTADASVSYFYVACSCSARTGHRSNTLSSFSSDLRHERARDASSYRRNHTFAASLDNHQEQMRLKSFSCIPPHHWLHSKAPRIHGG